MPITIYVRGCDVRGNIGVQDSVVIAELVKVFIGVAHLFKDGVSGYSVVRVSGGGVTSNVDPLLSQSGFGISSLLARFGVDGLGFKRARALWDDGVLVWFRGGEACTWLKATAASPTRTDMIRISQDAVCMKEERVGRDGGIWGFLVSRYFVSTSRLPGPDFIRKAKPAFKTAEVSRMGT